MSLMRRMVLAAFFISCLSCSEEQKKPTEQRIWIVSARGLHNSYLDFDKRYTNQTIACRLTGGEYHIEGTTIRWHAERDESPPDVVFYFPPVPSYLRDRGLLSNSQTVEIIGICKGTVTDNQARPSGRPFYVKVDASSIEVAPAKGNAKGKKTLTVPK